MNIFYLDKNPKKCAEYHCDKHVVKMILETAQLLCSSHWITGNEAPYKLSHKNHPCSIWVRESLSNYLFLCELGLELCKEYTHRYSKKHKSQDIIEWCTSNPPNISDKGFTNPPKAMPDEYKVEDVVQSYRNYYMGAKKDFAVWKNRDIPEWYKINEMKKNVPHIKMVLQKNYESFKEFYDENQVPIYKSIIQIFKDLKSSRKKTMMLSVEAKINDLEWDTDFTFNKNEPTTLVRDILPYFVSIEDYETCAEIRDVYKNLNGDDTTPI